MNEDDSNNPAEIVLVEHGAITLTPFAGNRILSEMVESSLVLATKSQVWTAPNITSRDCVLVSDVYYDACTIFGPMGQQKIFDKITTAVEILAQKAHWDPGIGYCDLQTNDAGSFTLPKDIETPLEINVDGQQTKCRTKWFEFHLDGSPARGHRSRWGDRGHTWDDMGDTIIVNQLPPGGAKIVAIPDSPADDGCPIQVWGLDANGRGINGSDGFTVPCVHGSNTPAANIPNILYFNRITKGPSTGFIKLVTLDVNDNPAILLGYYYPDEVEPRYRRIHIEHRARFIRMRYRKRSLKVTSMTDLLQLRSREAVSDMLRALKLKESDPKKARMFEQGAVEYLLQEQAINK